MGQHTKTQHTPALYCCEKSHGWGKQEGQIKTLHELHSSQILKPSDSIKSFCCTSIPHTSTKPSIFSYLALVITDLYSTFTRELFVINFAIEFFVLNSSWSFPRWTVGESNEHRKSGENKPSKLRHCPK